MEPLISSTRALLLLRQLYSKNFSYCNVCLRKQSTTMKAWRIHSYESGVPIRMNESTKIPTVSRPNEILIKVRAASVNPLDARMKEGYGKTVIGVMRQIDQCTLTPVSEFPLTLGRDCSGVVMETGRNVRKLKVGDEVWCALGAERQGCFAEYVLASESSMSEKPKNLNFVESASMPYVACTVWSAMCTIGRLDRMDRTGRPQSVLIHGGSGGIGTFAVQLAKAYNAEVTTTCSSNAFELVKSLGADHVIDYKAPDAFGQVSNEAPFDLIFDAVNTEFSRKTADLLRLWRGALYVTVSGPLLQNADKLGLPFGLCKSAGTFITQFAQNAVNGRLSAWAYVIPNGNALREVAKFVENGKIRPVIEKVYSFNELPEALEKVSSMHGRGKLVIDLKM